MNGSRGMDGRLCIMNEQGLEIGVLLVDGLDSWVANALGGPIDYDIPANTRLNSQFRRAIFRDVSR